MTTKKSSVNVFTIIAICISAIGFVLSFILGFPLSYFIGPFIGIAFGVVGFILGIIAFAKQRSTPSTVALVLGIALLGISFARMFALFSCVGGIVSLFS